MHLDLLEGFLTEHAPLVPWQRQPGAPLLTEEHPNPGEQFAEPSSGQRTISAQTHSGATF